MPFTSSYEPVEPGGTTFHELIRRRRGAPAGPRRDRRADLAMTAGGAVTGIGSSATDEEVARHLADSCASILVTDKPSAAGVDVIEIGPDLLAANGPARPARVTPDDPALLPYSSGTSGVDADGNVFVVDRLKELIKVNALQVAPAELEAVLAAHPAVAESAVVGRPDERRGEVPVAFVVARGEVDGDALMAWVAERVAPHKRLRDVQFVEQLPRTPAGKLLRRLLGAQPSYV